MERIYAVDDGGGGEGGSGVRVMFNRNDPSPPPLTFLPTSLNASLVMQSISAFLNALLTSASPLLGSAFEGDDDEGGVP